jgi:F420-non-reducing hydrogenase small subunit
MSAPEKLKVALYWAASCGGCEISVLEIHEKILDVAAAADIVFWPAAIDAKYKDVEAMEVGSIDLCLFNGGIRTAEHEHVAKMLRSKSKLLVAYGSCAQEGCIPGLANLSSREAIWDRVYHDCPTIDNPDKTLPRLTTEVPEGTLSVPEFCEALMPLNRVVAVDYYVPGCPPTGEQTWNVLKAIVSGAELPPRGSVIGAGEKTVCDECPREKKEKRVKRFYRPFEIIPDPKTCLLEQGIICCGPATRSGCDGRCVRSNMPCRGCYGPAPGIEDQGAHMMTAVTSIIDSDDPDEIESIVNQIVDPVGTFYRFSLADSLAPRRNKR